MCIRDRATKEAGRIAGLEVKRIINEPTAAALALSLIHISTTANIYAHLDSQSNNLSARTMASTLTLPEAQPIKKW